MNRFLDLADFPARQQDRRSQFDAGRVVEIDPVGDQRTEKTRRSEKDKNPRQDGDSREDQEARQDFITL